MLREISLPVLRAILASGVKDKCQTPEVKSALENVEVEVERAANTARGSGAYPAASAAANAVQATASAAGSAFKAANAARDASNAARATHRSSVYAAADLDADILSIGDPKAVFFLSLWPLSLLPNGLAE
ncbi:hypothetical protein JMK10_06400 [Rhodovulum sulfidophilum]|uniref:hypothetical protein n=1 Tax=Rhodovulum sulfidophilum TaxID=35806 RepID=UPI00192074BF|nr:hypothetical protein [Rhodovulum sulfidophilum]MBL3575271.1 hypothetical protein [Rhodovulum sulfidophilum]MCE8432433.1 hypothetical protein [Rhodovulum sulfidophilum]MCF4116441.1 hypothetical protein [Rhodovulum sulfidophilum]